MLEEIRRQLRLRLLLDEVDGEVEIGADDLAAAFQERRADLATPERRGVRNVVVPTRTAGDQVRNQLDAGADVAPLARRVSIDAATRAKGGDLESCPATSWSRRSAKQCSPRRPAVPTVPCRDRRAGTWGWSPRYCPSSRPRSIACEADLRAVLEAEESQRRWSAWLVDQLRAAEIEYADDYRPEDPFEITTWPGAAPSGVPGAGTAQGWRPDDRGPRRAGLPRGRLRAASRSVCGGAAAPTPWSCRRCRGRTGSTASRSCVAEP